MSDNITSGDSLINQIDETEILPIVPIIEGENTVESTPLNIDTNYELPTEKQAFVDTAGGDVKVVDKKDITPFQTIKMLAKEMKTEIKEPLKNCKKCYGRGYEGFDFKTRAPIPCRCIFRGKSENEKEVNNEYDNKRINGPVINRTQRRKLEKAFRKSLHK